MNKQITTIILALVIASIGFFGGIQYQKSQTPQRGTGTFQRRLGQNQNEQAVRGEILSTDATSMTVKMQDGSSKLIILSGSTNITKQATGSKDDLKQEQEVVVFGSTNSDGSVTAQVVQLNPMFRISPRPLGQ